MCVIAAAAAAAEWWGPDSCWRQQTISQHTHNTHVGNGPQFSRLVMISFRSAGLEGRSFWPHSAQLDRIFTSTPTRTAFITQRLIDQHFVLIVSSTLHTDPNTSRYWTLVVLESYEWSNITRSSSSSSGPESFLSSAFCVSVTRCWFHTTGKTNKQTKHRWKC